MLQLLTKQFQTNDRKPTSNIIIGYVIDVHRECLLFELKSKNLIVQKKKPIPIVYKDVKLDHGYRIDLLVENKVVIEIKTVEMFTEVHTAKALTYLK